jgi:hypothetical protein
VLKLPAQHALEVDRAVVQCKAALSRVDPWGGAAAVALRRDGKGWIVEFEGRSVKAKNWKGMTHLRDLVAHLRDVIPSAVLVDRQKREAAAVADGQGWEPTRLGHHQFDKGVGPEAAHKGGDYESTIAKPEQVVIRLEERRVGKETVAEVYQNIDTFRLEPENPGPRPKRERSNWPSRARRNPPRAIRRADGKIKSFWERRHGESVTEEGEQDWELTELEERRIDEAVAAQATAPGAAGSAGAAPVEGTAAWKAAAWVTPKGETGPWDTAVVDDVAFEDAESGGSLSEAALDPEAGLSVTYGWSRLLLDRRGKKAWGLDDGLKVLESALNAAKASGNAEEIQDAQTEIDEVKKARGSIYNQENKERTPAESLPEVMRKLVDGRLRYVCGKFAKIDPALGAHLKRSIGGEWGGFYYDPSLSTVVKREKKIDEGQRPADVAPIEWRPAPTASDRPWWHSLACKTGSYEFDKRRHAYEWDGRKSAGLWYPKAKENRDTRKALIDEWLSLRGK